MSESPNLGAGRFLVEQRIRPMINLYVVSTVDEAGNALEPVAFVRQKRLALREEIRFYSDEQETTEVCRLKARQVIEFGGSYDVTAPDGAPIGVLQKLAARSLLRSSWRIFGPDGTSLLFAAEERSATVAVLRRIWEFLPYVDVVPFAVPFHFNFLRDGEPVGTLDRKLALRDRYLLDGERLVRDGVDPRLLIAFGVALDALQAR
jgi:hypothetical protein